MRWQMHQTVDDEMKAHRACAMHTLEQKTAREDLTRTNIPEGN